MKTAAFFDMDRTLLRCNTGELWLQFLHQRGEISRLRLLQAMGWLLQYKLSILDIEAVSERVTRDMAGDSERQLIELSAEFLQARVLHQVAPAARQAIAAHRRQNHVVAILSSSTPYITEPLARHLQIDHVLCTRLTVQNGVFDGSYHRPACYGAGKVHYAEAFADANQVDLSHSFFYSDSFSDLPMLKRVGHARVVNPDLRLRWHALRVGWSTEQW